MIIHVNISEQCNLDCSFCYIHPKQKTILDINKFLQGFEAFRKICNENIVIRFFDGEPLLYVDKVLSIIEGTRGDVRYEVCTNLTYEITSQISRVLEECSVFTSGDPIPLRFKTQENFELGKYNCRLVRPEYVASVLTQEFLELEPRKLFEDFVSGGVSLLCLAYVDSDGKAYNWPIPKMEDIDNGLCKAYDVGYNELKVDLFEHYIQACIQNNLVKNESPGISGLSITSDGNILIDNSLRRVSLSIYDSIDHLQSVLDTCYHVNRTSSFACRICNLHGCCLTNINLRKIGKCTFPKKLFKKIAQDYNSNLLSLLEL